MPVEVASLIYDFKHRHGRPPRELADLLGGKGANLAEMTSVLGMPVPPGFTITTRACIDYLRDGWPAGLDGAITSHVAALEAAIGRRFGDDDDPLLVSVRSGAGSSMPGMMDTVLNLGLNRATTAALACRTDRAFAYDCFRRFIAMYARIVLGAQIESPTGATGPDACDALLAGLAHRGTPLPDNPRIQLRQAIEAVFRSWHAPRARTYRAREGIADNLGTAVNVQAMVFGNRDDNSGTGVAFTRNAATGEPRPYGDFLSHAQGEDVVAGIRKTADLDTMRTAMPAAHAELMAILARLEAHYRDMCDTEFTVESGKLWLLQTRVGKRTARAALRMAVDMARQNGWSISRDEAVRRVPPVLLDQLSQPTLIAGPLTLIGTGLPASPGVAIGAACFDAEACVDASADGPVVLVRAETSPEDVHGMQVAEGVLTTRGGLVSHAAVVARGWNIPAVVGAEAICLDGDRLSGGGHVIRAGEMISLDGTTGEIHVGALASLPGGTPPELATLIGWAAAIAGVPADGDPRAILEQARVAMPR